MFRVDCGMTSKDEGGRMKDERPGGHRSFSSFIPHPSSFLLVSAQEFLNVRVARVAKRFIRAAENDLSVTYHQDFTVNQAKFLALFFENHFTGFVDHSVF